MLYELEQRRKCRNQRLRIHVQMLRCQRLRERQLEGWRCKSSRYALCGLKARHPQHLFMFRSLWVAHPDLQQLVELGSMLAGWDLIGQPRW